MTEAPSTGVSLAMVLRRLVATFALLLGTALAQRSTVIPVRVDPRYELLAILFRTAGAEEYAQESATSVYTRAVDAHFAKFKEHAAIRAALALREERGIGFDAVASFAVHLAKPSATGFLVPLEPWPVTFDKRWDAASARAFAEHVVAFARDTGFEKFFAEQRPFYAVAEQRFSALLGAKPYRTWIEDFFGAEIGAGSFVIPGLLNGGANYGQSVRFPDGRLDVNPILGIGEWDKEGLPVVSEGNVPTAIHEFCHPFANRVIDAIAKELLPAGQRLLERKRQTLAAQAYGEPMAVLYESLVRACVTVLLAEHRGDEAGDEQERQEVARGFWFTPVLRGALVRYAKERAKFAKLADFAPELVKALADLDAIFARAEAALPKVVKITPSAGATGVVREVEFRVEFDRPMLRTSRGLTFADGITFEKVVPGTFDATGTVYTTTLRLPAGTKVQCWLNRFGSGLASATGYALDPVELTFTTAD